MKNKMAVAVIAGLLLSQAGCLGGGQDEAHVWNSDSMQTVCEAVEQVSPMEDHRTLEDADLEGEFGLDEDLVESFMGETSGTVSDGGVILLLHTEDGAAAKIREQLEAYRQEKVQYYANYEEFETAQENTGQARIRSSGNYVIYVAASDGEDYPEIDRVLDQYFD